MSRSRKSPGHPTAGLGLAAFVLLGTAILAGAGLAHTKPGATPISRSMSLVMYVQGDSLVDATGRSIQIGQYVSLPADDFTFINSRRDSIFLSIAEQDPENLIWSSTCLPIKPSGRVTLQVPADAKFGAAAAVSFFAGSCPPSDEVQATSPIKPILTAPSIRIGDGP